MSKAVFIKAGRGLLPGDEEAQEIMSAMPEGKEVLINIHSPRNIRHHKLFFALLNEIVEAGAWTGDTENLRASLLYETGCVDIVVRFDGTIEHKPRSMAFESMPQDRFNRFFDRAIYVVSTQLLQSEDWEELKQKIYESVDGEMGKRMKENDERYVA